MSHLDALPNEALDLVIEYLVLAIGIRKAVFLRSTSRRFDVSIQKAICVTQIVDIYDPHTPDLEHSIGDHLRSQILVAKSRFPARAADHTYISVLASVNQALDTLTVETDQQLLKHRHQSVAKAISTLGDGFVDAKLEAQNILSGAIVLGDTELVKSLLAPKDSSPAKADVNGYTPYFGTPLTIAASWGHVEIVRHLLDCGARPNLFSTDCRPEKEINWQAMNPNSDEEASLWRASSYTGSPASALRAAILGGHGEVCQILLLPEHRIPCATLEYLRTVVACAKAGRPDLIQTLLQATGRKLSDFPGLMNEMLWVAIRFNRKEVVQILLDDGADINAFPYPDVRPFHGTLDLAASLGNVSMVRFLIECGADPNFCGVIKNGNSPIEGAARYGQEAVVALLLQNGADPVHALLRAAKEGQPRVVKLVLDKSPDIIHQQDEDGSGEVGEHALMNALCARNLTTIALLVKYGVSINDGYESFGCLPIEMAKQGFEPWVIDHLISLGARDTDTVAQPPSLPVTVGHVLITKQTWNWVGKY